MRESRLCRLLLSDVNKQRQAVGAAAVSPNPQSVNSPVTQIQGRVSTPTGTATVADVRNTQQNIRGAQAVTITPGVNAPVDYKPLDVNGNPINPNDITGGNYEQVGDTWRPITGSAPTPTQNSGAGGNPGALGYNPAPGGYNPKRISPEDAAKKAGDDVVESMKKSGAHPSTYEKAYNDAYASALAKEKGAIDLQTSQKQKDKADADLRGSYKQLGGEETVQKPSGQTAVTMMLRGMGPEGAALASAMEEQNLQNATAQQEAKTLQGDLLKKNEQSFNDVKSQLEQMKTDATENRDLVQGLLQDIQQENQTYIAQQQKAADEQLVWQAQKQERTLAKQKIAQRESMIANYALFGGFGQDAALRSVAESDNAFESKIMDVQTELGYARTDVAVKFTGMYLQNNNAYREGLIGTFKDMQSQLTNINLQGISNTQAKGQAEQTILQNGWNALSSLRKEYSANNLANVKDMTVLIQQEKTSKRQDELQAWNQLEWLKTTFGANVPENMVKGVAEKLPGIDVKGLLALPTLAEMKAKKTGGSSGGGISFAPHQKTSDGHPPTFEDFVRQKETEALQSGATSFDTSSAAMGNYRKEYDIRVKEAERLNPTTIWSRMEDATKNMTEAFRVNNIKKTVEGYLKAGQLDQADNYVAGLGKTMSADERKSFQKAAGAKQNVQRVSQLIEEIGTIGPVIGRVRQLNPYDDSVVEFDNLVTQTIPGLARGIFGEVGVLTDQDISTYRKTMANPTLTLDQARTATRNLLQTIELSIQNQVDLARAAGVNTRDTGIYLGIENRETMLDPLQPGGIPQVSSPTLEASRAYAQSLLQIR